MAILVRHLFICWQEETIWGEGEGEGGGGEYRNIVHEKLAKYFPLAMLFGKPFKFFNSEIFPIYGMLM